MANIDAPTGLRPIANDHGVVPITHWSVAATYASAIYEGQMLYRRALGDAAISDGTTAAQLNHTIGVASHYVPATPGSSTGLPVDVAVYSDKNQKYLIQGDDNTVSTTADILAARGLYAVPVNATTNNTTTLQSKMEIDTSALTTVCDTDAAATVFQIDGYVTAADNDYSVANEAWVVKIPERFFLGYGGRTVL